LGNQQGVLNYNTLGFYWYWFWKIDFFRWFDVLWGQR